LAIFTAIGRASSRVSNIVPAFLRRETAGEMFFSTAARKISVATIAHKIQSGRSDRTAEDRVGIPLLFD
jgi:hypothetical protein